MIFLEMKSFSKEWMKIASKIAFFYKMISTFLRVLFVSLDLWGKIRAKGIVRV